MVSADKSMTFHADPFFKTNDKELELYNRYGIPAIELADKRDFLVAVKLIDKILKVESECEFALFLKANYLYNHFNLEISNKCIDFIAMSIGDIGNVHQDAKHIQKQFEKCIRLFDKVIEINPANKEAKGFKTFIEDGSLKSVNNLIKLFEDEIKKRPNMNNNLIEKTQRIETSEFETYEIEINEDYSQEKKNDEITDGCGCLLFIIIFLLIFWWLW